MRKISIADITLASSMAAPKAALSFKEKIETARHLQNLNVDVIELSAIENPKTDALFIRTLAPFVKDAVISVDAGQSEQSIEDTWNSLAFAKKPRLRIELPVSPVQMEYMCHKKEPKMLEHIKALVVKCSALCKEVEFRAIDAVRAEKAFLDKAIAAAIEAGATVVTVCDNEGAMLPDEFYDFISEIRQICANVTLGVLCENNFKMALACSVMAMKAGADEIKASAADENVPSVAELAKIIANSGDINGFCASLKYTELNRTIKQIQWITNTKRSENSPFDNGVSDANPEHTIALNKNDSFESVCDAVVKLGYDLSDEDSAKVYEEFQRVAEKKSVASKELDAIVASVALQVPPTFKLLSYVINSGNVITASAHIRLEKNGREVAGISLGDGPIDAAFIAIEQIVGHHYELDDFQIQAVTEGREAMGSALVKLRNNGKLYSGNGISTDIIGASIAAYLNALNKITYEEA